MTRTLTRQRVATPDSHDFPTRPYDLVREFVVALAVVTVLSLILAGIFSSPDRKAISLADWAKADPNDVVATATAELAGTSTSAGYGAPYNHASTGQQLGPLYLQNWAGARIPVDSANDLVIDPLRAAAGASASSGPLQRALRQWTAAPAGEQARWAGHYADALTAAPNGDPSRVRSGDYGPVPVLANGLLGLARSGGLEGALSGNGFYASDQTKPLLLLADGAFLEDQARADHLGGDQWGMMNESGNYPGQPWMWLYTFWYQVPPFSTSGNADALVWAVMLVLTLVFVLVPFIPGLRSIPKYVGVHRLIWRN